MTNPQIGKTQMQIVEKKWKKNRVAAPSLIRITFGIGGCARAPRWD